MIPVSPASASARTTGKGFMAPRLYLINPRSDMPGYFGADALAAAGFAPAVGIADLATATVAALAPAAWSVRICDEHVQPVDLDADVDFVGVTGKITQLTRMLELCDAFRNRGKVVVVGGPFASLCPDAVRGHCDVLVIGELEDVAGELFSDLGSGRWRSEYVSNRPDLGAAPIPRWDLYPNDRALIGCVQTSRGCPFECEFCDVIPYLGRKQRHKPPPRVLAELETLYALGYRAAFLADDNFTVYRRRTKELLAHLRVWNATKSDGPMTFSTQVSIDAARDAELLRMCSEAHLSWVFIGIETPNEASLRECKKRQNVGIDLLDQIRAFLAHGISVTAGMIVGFDHDGPDIFERQFEFAMASPVPIFSLGALVAPFATPLFRRLQQEGRLIAGGSEVAATPWDTNIVPARLSRTELMSGLRWLCNELYRPENFGKRVLQMIDCLEPPPGDGSAWSRTRRPIESEAMLVVKNIGACGGDARRMLKDVLRAMSMRPHTRSAVMTALFRYAQVQCMHAAAHSWESVPATAAPNVSTRVASTPVTLLRARS